MSQSLSQRRKLCERVAAYFEASGQPCEIVEDEENPDMVVLECPLAINLDVEGGSPEVTEFTLNVMPLEDSFGDMYVRLVILPFADGAGDEPGDELSRELARLNHDMPQLKFALDDAGDLELLTDIPATQLNEEGLQSAVKVLVDYLNHYYEPLSSLLTPASDTPSE
ncbi:MAG: hypothetical protein JOZ02_00710 [Acidobacteria bacterium]|nr:hypothetical protein [Acidobacteriota bacterium]